MSIWDYTSSDTRDASPSPAPQPTQSGGIWNYQPGQTLTPGLAAKGALAVTKANPSALVQAPYAPDSFTIPGFALNALRGVAGMVHGITDILGAVGHDVAVTGAKILTPGIDTSLEHDKSEVVQTASKLLGIGPQPSTLRLQYQHYYGPLVKGDFEEFLHNVYNDPVALALDLTAAGDVIAAPARAGALLARRAGTEVPEWAATILGPGSREITSTTSAGIRTVRLSSNPIIRGAQDLKNALLTEPAFKALGRLEPGTPGYEIASKQVGEAMDAAYNRVYRPFVSRELETNAARQLSGLKQSLKGERAGQALSELNSDYMYGPRDTQAIYGDVLEGMEGARVPEAPVGPVTEFTLPKELPLNHPYEITPVNDARGLEIMKSLSDEFDPRGPFTHPAVTSPGAGSNVWQVRVGSLTDVPALAERAAQSLGGDVLGIENLFKYDVPEAGVNAFVRIPETGEVVRVSFGTDKFFRAENAFYEGMKTVDTMRQQLIESQSKLDEALATGDEKAAALAQRDIDFYTNEIQAGEAYVPTMFEGPANELRQALGQPYARWHSIADEHRVWNFKWNELPEIGSGNLTFQSIMNRAYGPQRLASYMESMAEFQKTLESHFIREGVNDSSLLRIVDSLQGFPDDMVEGILNQGVKSTSPARAAQEVANNLADAIRENVMNGELPGFRWQDMHSARRQAELPTPHYYSHRPISGTPSDTAMKGGSSLARVNVPGHLRNKWMGWLEEQGKIVRDPVEVATRTFQEINLHQQLIEHTDRILQEFGWPISDAEFEVSRYMDMRNGSVVYINPAEAKAQLGIRGKLAMATTENIMQGMGPLEATSEAVKRLLPDIQKEAIQASTGKVYAVPRHVAKVLQGELTRATGWKAKIFWENPTSVWRAAVLSFSPRWIINNTIGNIIFQGVEDPRAFWYSIRQLSKKQRGFLEYVIGSERLSDIESGFIHNLPGGRYFRGANDIVESAPGWAKASEFISERAPVRGLRWWSNLVRRTNAAIEEAFRRGSYMSAVEKQSILAGVNAFKSSGKLLEKLAREGITESAHSAALRAVNRTLGNYTALTPTEQNVMRGVIAPFYSFYRHVAKFVARMPFDHPLKAIVLTQIDKMDKDMQAALPEWLYGSQVVGKLGDGQDLYYRPDAVNPLGALFGNETGFAALLHPAIKIGIERSLGVSAFTGREFYDPNIFEARDGSRWQIVRDGKTTRVVRVEGKTLPSWWEHVGMQFPEYTLAQDVLAAINPGYGGQASATGKVITENGIPKYPRPPWTIFTNYMGIPLYPFNTDEAKRQYIEAQREALQAAYSRIP